MFPSERFEEKLSVFEKNVSFFNIFGYWVNNFWPSAIKVSLDLSKPVSTCPKEQFEAIKLFLNTVPFSKHVRTLNEKNSSFCRKFFGEFAKAQPYVSVGTYWEKKTFSEKQDIFSKSFLNLGWRFFGFLPGKFRRVVKIAFYVSIRPV